ncbi:thioredoxin family protein [Actinoplanes sp. NBC_00393]|uniref:TlpA family protein disulfide reductase n=1 Tax=Actinoplanes sp. NBC_00393 TaxID=2975953 RepID=UPI002E238595
MDPVGLGVVGLVLVAGVAAGLWRRRTDGRLRAVGPEGATSPMAAAPFAADAKSAADGAALAEADGSVQDQGMGTTGAPLDPALLKRLGVEPAAATLLQFSTAFCAPCRAMRRVSAEVAALLPGVRHVEVDAESHLDEVRALDIWRTPTLLVLDADGRVTRRATGVPTKPHLIAALAEILAG